jgi:hypothetical protein
MATFIAAGHFFSAAGFGFCVGVAVDGWFGYRAGFLTRSQVMWRLPAVGLAALGAATGWA